ncbi:MAG: DUF402 domain-containing protein [Thermomicrobiales bacterium]
MTDQPHHHMPDATWIYGDVVALRFTRNRPADSILPVRVVADDPSHVALYVQPGSPRKIHATAGGGALPRAIPFLERERLIGGLRDHVWTERHVLMVQEPDRLSSIWYWWNEKTWEFIGAYVNLQWPLLRTPVGFDTADYLLDVVIHPDLSWEWKDEDELADAVEAGIVDPDLVRALRAEGERTIADLAARRWPFDTDYAGWRPDPAWTVPALPDGWDDGLVFPE